MNSVVRDVVVNGEAIPSAVIAAEAQNHNAPSDKPGSAWRSAAQALVIRTLLLQEAGRLGLAADPQMLASDKRETDEEALIRAVLDQELEATDVTEADCKQIFEHQNEMFRSPSLFQPAHILFAAKPEDKAARDIAKKNAAEFIATIQKNPKAFGDIAKSHSDCPSKEAAGTLGQIGSGDTVAEFEAVLDILPAGELHPEPVETRFGIHIIRMDEKVAGKPLPFDAVKGQIKERLEQVAWARAANALTHKLVAQADISGIEMQDATK